MKFKLALLCSLGFAASNALACYVVYDPANRIVYNAATPPVDMSLPIHQTLPAVFPGGHMVFSSGTSCPSGEPAPRVAAGAPASAASPLLTDRRTAAAMHVPHTILASGAALIQQRPDSMRPGVVVASSITPVSMNAAPAATGTARRAGTVITEMHNPPLTAVQMGGASLAELR